MESPRWQYPRSKSWLPIELWNHTIGFLCLDPYALLACCLTCSTFHGLARWWLDDLRHLATELSNHTDINRFLEWNRLTPDGVKCIRTIALRVYSSSQSPLPVALSATLHGFAERLVNVTNLVLNDLPHADVIHWSVWPQFGRTFPRMKVLQLGKIEFPSFVDFARFLTSFRVAHLELYMAGISWVYQPEVLPRGFSRKPFKQELYINLGTDRWGHVGLRYIRTFLEWVLPRGGVVSSYIFSVWPREPKSILPSEIGILEMIHTHLRRLTFSCDSLQEICLQFDWRVWRDVFSLDFRDLRSMVFLNMQGSHVPYIRIVIAHVIAISKTSHVTLYYSQPENPESDVWQCHTLDAILFALDRRGQIHARVQDSKWLHHSDLEVSRAFPLLSALNEFRWLGFEDDV